MKRRPRPVRIHPLFFQAVRFATLELVIDQIERGELPVVEEGGVEVWGYQDLSDMDFHALTPAMNGWCEFMRKMCAHFGQPAGVERHEELILALENDLPVTNALLRGVRAEIDRHKSFYRRTTPELRSSIATTCQIMFKLEDMGMTSSGGFVEVEA